MDLKNEPLLTTEEVAEILHCKPTYIQKKCRNREIPYIPSGKRYLFERKDIEAYLESIKIQKARKRPF